MAKQVVFQLTRESCSSWAAYSVHSPASSVLSAHCLMLPGASAKQSTIFHITLLRVLSPQQLAPADVAVVQAAVDAAAAPLVGLRFTSRHMLCGPAMSDA